MVEYGVHRPLVGYHVLAVHIATADGQEPLPLVYVLELPPSPRM